MKKIILLSFTLLLFSISFKAYAINCSAQEPMFRKKAKEAFILSKKISENFLQFKPIKPDPNCKPFEFADDGGEHCAFKCVFDNGEAGYIEMELIQTKWRKFNGKKKEIIELISLKDNPGL